MIPIIILSSSTKKALSYVKKLRETENICFTDIFEIKPEKNKLLISQIRELKKIVSLRQKNIRLFVLHQFDLATQEAQNALLKTLEEKTEKNRFVLIIKNYNKVISTILSRSKTIVLDRKNINSEKESLFIDSVIKSTVNAEDYRFLSIKQISKISRSKAVSFLEGVIKFFREKITSESPITNAKIYIEIIKKTLSLRNLMLNNNLNPQLVVDNVLIYIKKKYNEKKED